MFHLGAAESCGAPCGKVRYYQSGISTSIFFYIGRPYSTQTGHSLFEPLLPSKLFGTVTPHTNKVIHTPPCPTTWQITGNVSVNFLFYLCNIYLLIANITAAFICFISTALGEVMRNFIVPEYNGNKDHEFNCSFIILSCRASHYIKHIQVFIAFRCSYYWGKWKPQWGAAYLFLELVFATCHLISLISK